MRASYNNNNGRRCGLVEKSNTLMTISAYVTRKDSQNKLEEKLCCFLFLNQSTIFFQNQIWKLVAGKGYFAAETWPSYLDSFVFQIDKTGDRIVFSTTGSGCVVRVYVICT